VKNGGGDELGFRRLGLGALGAARAWIGGPRGGGAAYKGRVTALACGSSTEGACAAAGQTRPGSPIGIWRGEGDDRWSPPVIDCGRGRRRSGLAAAACWAGWGRRGAGLGHGEEKENGPRDAVGCCCCLLG
jgi:hypothetical protein